ncbi:T9SS sorting signal type C domain-containing protein [Flavobacterium macrobrachii]|uniref:T9SS sorting signal type C domain-containing protein n=1 Tax=Flavobacterium macrobrachii TaxID=591204 RepID=A0ABS2CY91_9FLAO|nr:T9SS sorting signal type C domain-containing protein [Flavobacterium macrobrachii]MBM6499937.1 T9SS sorting signal type C domain-containing protein [Flavobacterium macrobrachii]
MKNNTLLFGSLCSNSLPSATYKNYFTEKITDNAKSIHKRWMLMPLMALVFLFTNGNAWGQVVQTYTTAGSYTWRCPADVTSVTVECWGGGGGGGGNGGPATSNHSRGGGGAGGGYVKRTTYTVIPGTVYSINVGSAGSAGSAGNSSTAGGDGGEGGASWFETSSTIVAVGGNGGKGGGITNGTHNGAGGAKKSSGNIGFDVGISYYGGSGSSGLGAFNNSSAAVGNSGAGGASAGTSADGGNASGITAGTAVTDGVAGVGGRNSSNNGIPGNAGGGGGGGGFRWSSTSGNSGGAGGVGKVVLTYSYCASAAVSVGQGTWTNNQNDNTSGLGAWTLSSGGGGGHFAAGSGSGNDILNGGTNAWGMFANGTNPASNFSNATRTVTMNVGNVLSFSMDNMGVNTGSSVGISLQNSSGNSIMEFYFRGGQSIYEIADNAGSNISTGVPYTTNGLNITITYVSTTTYDISITPRNGSTTTMSGRTFSNPPGGRVPGIIRFFNAGAGGSGVNVYFNSLTISRPIITAHPSTGSQSTCNGSGTDLSVTAIGASSYQWFSATDAGGTTGVTSLGSNNGAQTATYTPTSASAGTLYYYCVVTGSCGSTARSNVSGAVTFNAPAVGGTASATFTSLCLNSSTGLSLTGHTGTIQWQRSEDNSSWSNISGATSTSYTTPNLIVTNYYRAVLTNGTCTANSNVLTLTVPSAGYVSNASLSTYNSSWSNSQNDNTTGFGAWTLSTSGTAGFFTGSSDINNGGSRSWGLFANNGSVANAVRTASMSIGNTISFSMDNNWIDNSYSVGFNLQNASGENLMGFYFTGGGSNYMISDNAGANSSGVGYTAGGLDVSIAYTGANTYAIYITGKGGTTVSLTGRTFTTQSGGQVPAQIRFYNGGSGNGSNYDLFFNSLSISNPVITAHPSTDIQSVCQNTSAIALSLTASGATSYQWFSATNAAGTTGVTNLGSGNGAQTNSYTPSTASVGTLYYYCQVTNSSCGTVISNLSGAVTVTASNVVSVTIASSDADNIICSGTSITFTATPTNGGVSPSYQWKLNGVNVGTNSATYTTTTLANNDAVTVELTSNATCPTGSPATSNSILMTVNTNWIGTTTSWTTPENWTCGVPLTTTEVRISSAGAYPEINSNVTISSLILDTGTTLKVNPTFNLTVTDVIANNGILTIENNANLLQTNNVANTGSGSTIVKRNSNPLIRFDYTLWSSPVAGQGLYAFSPFTSVVPNIRFYEYNPIITSPATTGVYSNDLGFTLSGLDGNNVNGTDTSNIPFATGKGYLIRLPWNHPTVAAVWNGQFTGVPNNGTQNVSIINQGDRYNAVGNPYPSPISISQFASDNSDNIETTLYFWRKTNNAASPSYCTWNTATSTYGDNGQAYTENPAGVIQTGQGFFVRAKVGATTIAFNNGQRIGNNANQFFRTPENSLTTIEANRIWLNMTGATAGFSQSVVGYFSNSELGLDDTDSRFFNDGPISLTTTIAGEDYVIQGRPLPFDATDVVPMKYKVTTAGIYTIAIDHVDGLFITGQEIFLRDNLNAVVHNLTAGAYTFTSDAGTFNNRFEVVYQSQLAVDDQIFNSNQVIIYKNEINDFVINSGNVIIANVKVFDVRGRLLQEHRNVNASQTTISVGLANEMLLIQITSKDDVTVVKKVVR